MNYLRSPETCLSISNNLGEKLVSSLESTTLFDQRFKVTAVPFFIPDFDFLSCELDNSKFTLLY